MKEKKISFHKIFGNEYYVCYGGTTIGEIEFQKRENIFILLSLILYPEFRKQKFGYMVVEHILDHYKFHCMVGETLETSRGFWRKCIKKYDGERRNIACSNNCTSCFVIPKYKNITNDKIYDLLEELNHY